jgi:hypothetical protein
MGFLPDDYKRPSGSNKYLKFEEGKTTFRITSKPIFGFEAWYETDDGRKVKRVKMDEKSELKGADQIKHFWAFTVWNYDLNSNQVSIITQATIQGAVEDLVRDEDWGSPVGNEGYDISITRTGKGKETTYSVIAKPKKKIEKAILDQIENETIKLEALYDGADPFSDGDSNEEAPVDPKDLPF